MSVEALQALERQIKELRDRVELMAISREALVSKVDTLEVAETSADQAALVDDAQLMRLLPLVQDDESFQQAFDSRLALVKARLQADLGRLDQQLSALRASEKALVTDLEQQSDDLISLQQLTREAEATRVLYHYFLTRFNETSAQQGIQQADSRILSDAVVPDAPSEPRKSLILAMSGMLGLMLGVGAILMRERTKQRVSDSRRS